MFPPHRSSRASLPALPHQQVFWRSDNAWYAGVIEDQQSSGDGGPGDVVLSKVSYDDGDVEVLDLVGGAEQVVLLTRADGTPSSDAEDGDVYAYDDEDSDDGLGGLAIPVSRRRAAKEGGGGFSGDGGSGVEILPVSRRAAAKEAASAPFRSHDPAGQQGLSAVNPFAGAPVRRNPARAAAGGNGDGEVSRPHDEFPPADAKVASVLAMMKANDAARVLAELPEEREPSGEVYRLGYKMGAQRAIACCAAVIAASAARRQTGASVRGGGDLEG